ncbi:PEP-CTERM sorting domain-containing protein [Thiohalocapsa halophila]|nr:PEP-CTERM sorting domain-containing protein [Thiohalocapsa halophila]
MNLMQPKSSPALRHSLLRRVIGSGVTGLTTSALALAMSGTASAAIITVQLDFSANNDCSGVLGTNPQCSFNDSPQILKQDLVNGDGSAGETSINPIFSSIDGSEFDFSNDGGSTVLGLTGLASENGDNWKSGSWSYTRDDLTDPAVKYVSLKYARNYSILFDVDSAVTSFPGLDVCSGWDGPDADNPSSPAPSADCQTLLDLALPITSGEWGEDTELTNGLSHIMFLDSEGGDLNPPAGENPVPGTLALLGIGLAGGAVIRRRRRMTT